MAKKCSPEEQEAWKETAEILADEDLMNDIRASQADFEAGKRTYSLEEIKAEQASRKST